MIIQNWRLLLWVGSDSNMVKVCFSQLGSHLFQGWGKMCAWNKYELIQRLWAWDLNGVFFLWVLRASFRVQPPCLACLRSTSKLEEDAYSLLLSPQTIFKHSHLPCWLVYLILIKSLHTQDASFDDKAMSRETIELMTQPCSWGPIPGT